jgi:hypothetical protein
MPAKLAEADQMTIAGLLPFTRQRSGGKRWELIDAVALKSAALAQWQQRISTHSAAVLNAARIKNKLRWIASLGLSAFLSVGTHVQLWQNGFLLQDIYVQEQPGTT